MSVYSDPKLGCVTVLSVEGVSIMMRVLVVLVAVLFLPLAALAPKAVEERAVQTGSAAYEVDMAHSMLIYKIRHLNVAYFHGRVKLPTGSFFIDKDNPENSTVHIIAEIKNMDAGNRSRDIFLKSPDFFNARDFPKAEFKSTTVRKVNETTYEATGTFTMHGVTKEITTTLEDYTEADTGKLGFRAGFEAIFTVKRSDFGIDKFVKEGTLGDEVRITAAIQGVQR